MSKMIFIAIRERKVTIILSLLVILYALYTYYYLPRQENPDTSSPAVQIITVYPGANAKTVEEQVTKKIEDEVSTLDGVESLRSFSQDNVSIVIAMLGDNVDYDAQWDKLRVGLEQLKGEMPEGVRPFDVNTDMTTAAGLIICLSSDIYDTSILGDIAEVFKSELASVAGVKRVEISGVPEMRFQIQLDLNALSHYNLSVQDVYRIIQAQNVVIPSGSIQTEQGKINVQVPKSIESIKDLQELVITLSSTTGAMVRLKDVALVSISTEKSDLYFQKDGRSALMITATFNDDENVVLIGKDVRVKVEQLKKQYPTDLSIDEVLFQPEDVDVAINSFIISLLQGIGFVILVVFIGMGVRNAAIVSVAIPLSLAMTIISMGALKVDLQQVSISALIIALGMLVDNAIVISDAIQVYINEGVHKMEACFKGAKEQAIPVFTSTLTTMVAFLPLMGLPSSAGEFISSLPLIVIIALFSSFIVAMLVTPALASMTLKHYQAKYDFIAPVRVLYTKVLENNLKHPFRSLSIVLLMVIGAVILFTTVDMRLFPFVDKNIVYVNIQNEIGGDIDSTEKLVKQAEALLSAEPEIVDETIAIGGGLPRFYMTADIVMPSEGNGQILARFDLEKEGRFKTRGELLYYLQNKFDANFVGGYATVNMLEINMPGATIEVRVSGRNEEALKKVSESIYQYLLARDETMNVQLRQPNYRYTYQLSVDDQNALQLGLTKYDIQSQINLALHGAQVSTFIAQGKTYPIYIQADVDSIEAIEGMSIKSSITGKQVLVRQFATVNLQQELDVIRRYNRENVITVSSDVRPEFGSGNLQSELDTFIATLDTSEAKVTFGGDQETMTKYLSGLAVAAVFAMVGIYIILMIQFNSILQPVIILATVPLALIGVVVALVLTGTNFTFTVGLGSASLIGVVVNNAILLIDYINRARIEGMSVIDACRDSVSKRMRPILLTTITTVFGLIPLVFADSSFFTPMAIALMGGLIVATFMTLTVIPTLYYALVRFEGKVPTE